MHHLGLKCNFHALFKCAHPHVPILLCTNFAHQFSRSNGAPPSTCIFFHGALIRTCTVPVIIPVTLTLKVVLLWPFFVPILIWYHLFPRSNSWSLSLGKVYMWWSSSMKKVFSSMISYHPSDHSFKLWQLLSSSLHSLTVHTKFLTWPLVLNCFF